MMDMNRLTTDLASCDQEKLLGHYLIAGMDGRLEDQDLLGRELIRRGQMSEAFHQRQMRTSGAREPLRRPIIAGPKDTELVD